MILILVFLSTVKATDVVYTLFSNHSLLHVPKKPVTEDNIIFLLFTRQNPMLYQLLSTKDPSSLNHSNFAFNQTTKVIVHGWIVDNQTSLAMEELKNAYINATDYNVIIVDWSILAEDKYKVAKSFVSVVSSVLIIFLNFLIKSGLKIDYIHLIGHCLGAHIAGIAGRHFRQKKQPLYAIVGLDPAYPLYKFTSEDHSLDKSDAKHVEVVHTSSGCWGHRTPLGHVDYYPNGGQYQPGCDDLKDLCAHYRAVHYYAHSITSEHPFTAVLWESYEKVYYYTERVANMSALHLNTGLKGTFYFKTDSTAPFALGDIQNWVHEIMSPNEKYKRFYILRPEFNPY